MKIPFSFDNLTQLQELYDSVENIPQEILDDAEVYGTPTKEQQALIEVIENLRKALDNETN